MARTVVLTFKGYTIMEYHKSFSFVQNTQHKFFRILLSIDSYMTHQFVAVLGQPEAILIKRAPDSSQNPISARVKDSHNSTCVIVLRNYQFQISP